VAARAWTQLMRVIGLGQARYDEALALRPRVTAVLERLGGNNDELAGQLADAVASILLELQRFPDAPDEAARGLALLERRFGRDDLRVADVLDTLGNARVSSHTGTGRAEFERALAIKERVYGPDHPEVARALVHVAMAYDFETKYDEARKRKERALAIIERALGPEHPDVAKAAHNLAITVEAMGDYARALDLRRRAVAIGKKTIGERHPTYGAYLLGLGTTLQSLGRNEEALAAFTPALALFERVYGEKHTRTSHCRELLARSLLLVGRVDEARLQAQRTLAAQEAEFGRGDWEARMILALQGEIEIFAKQPARAVAPLERSYALFGSHKDADPGEKSEVQYYLGRALVESGHDGPRARALVTAAQEEFASDDRVADFRAELARWATARGWKFPAPPKP
jgi:serine/threonine-protein kinase